MQREIKRVLLLFIQYIPCTMRIGTAVFFCRFNPDRASHKKIVSGSNSVPSIFSHFFFLVRQACQDLQYMPLMFL